MMPLKKSDSDFALLLFYQRERLKHRRYKDEIVRFFMNMKDRVRVEDLRVY